MLANQKTLIETDPDLQRVATIDIGFNDNGCLTVIYEVKDYDNTEDSYLKYAVIEKEDAYYLSKRLKVRLTQLPDYFEKEFGDSNPGEASLSEARMLFKDILNYFKYNHTHYQLKDEL